MTKPSKKGIWDEMKEALRYRWEFVRRNKDYRGKYDEFHAEEEKQDIAERASKYDEIFEEFGFPVIPYDMDFDEVMESVQKAQKAIDTEKLSFEERKSLSLIRDFWDQYIGTSIVSLEAYSEQSITGQRYYPQEIKYKRVPYIGNEKEFENAKTLMVSINLECPKKQILEFVSTNIDFVNRHRKNIDNTPKQTMQYKPYLTAYDIMEQCLSDGMGKEEAYEEIAKKIFGKEYDRALIGEDLGGDKKDPQSVLRKAKRYSDEAKRLVEGGFRQIR